MKTINLVSWIYRKLTWRRDRMWLWLWAKSMSLLAIRVICPMFPTRVAGFPDAGTVRCKITQIQLKDVLVHLNIAYRIHHMNSCLIYLSFHFYLNKNMKKIKIAEFHMLSKKNSKCVVFLSVILLRAVYRWPNTHTILMYVVWGIHLPDCLQQKEYIVYLIWETSQSNHNLGEGDQH